jgi:hypothetical protein
LFMFFHLIWISCPVKVSYSKIAHPGTRNLFVENERDVITYLNIIIWLGLSGFLRNWKVGVPPFPNSHTQNGGVRPWI